MTSVARLAPSDEAKEGKRLSAPAGRLVEDGRGAGWEQAINQTAASHLDRFDKYR